MKKITIWGGSGFIGSHVSDVLSEKGYKVIVADKVKSQYLKKNQVMFIGDIANIKDVNKSIINSSFVFNFSGISHIEDSNKKPVDVVKSNILGNINILESCKKYSIKKYIFASTIYVYSKYGGFYRSSKQSAELFIKEYYKQFKLNYNILRFGTVYGPRSNYNNSIKRYLEQAINNKKIKINSDKDIIREYIHVNDIANYCIKILDKKYDNIDFILTGNSQIRINDLFNLISEILGKKTKVTYNKNFVSSHYKITPYSYIPNLSKKISINNSVDLGEGLLQLVYEIKNKAYKKK